MYFSESKWGFVSQCLNELPIVLCKKCIKKHGFMHPGAYFMHVLFNSDKFAFIRKVSIIVAVNGKGKDWRGVPHIAHWKEWHVARREIVCPWKRACNTTLLCSWKRACDTCQTNHVCSLKTSYGLCYTHVVIAMYGKWVTGGVRLYETPLIDTTILVDSSWQVIPRMGKYARMGRTRKEGWKQGPSIPIGVTISNVKRNE